MGRSVFTGRPILFWGILLSEHVSIHFKLINALLFIYLFSSPPPIIDTSFFKIGNC
jgi:hypothetical protein